MKNLRELKEGVTELFGDTSVPPTVTLESLQELREHINDYIEAIESDLRNGN